MPFLTPETSVRLISNTKLISGDNNQLLFPTLSEQAEFFLSKVSYNLGDNFRYLRKNEYIDVNINFESLTNCDYAMYRNRNFYGDWVYAYITQMEYKNDTTTRIYLEMDCFQTHMFALDYYKSYIVRSHAPNEMYGNLIPEGLETGRDYLITHTERITFDTYYALISSSIDLTAESGTVENVKVTSASGGVFDHMPTATNYYVVDGIIGGSDLTSSLTDILGYLAVTPWVSQGIQSITIVPKEVIGNAWSSVSLGSLRIGVLPDGFKSESPDLPTITNFRKHFPNYTNNKLYSYPYSYLELTLFNGTQLVIKPEGLDSDDLQIGIINYVGSQPRLSYYIDGYNSYGDNGIDLTDHGNVKGEFLDQSLTAGNFPQLPVLLDNYMLYMANNSNAFQMTQALARFQQAEGLVSGAGKALTGNIGGGLATAYSGVKQGEITIRQQSAKQQDMEITPPSLSGQSGGDAFNIANNITGVVVRWKMLRPQYVERIEKYLERFGMMQNVIDVPTLKGMSVFNYVQTIDITLGGNIPNDDMEKIQRMYNTGVTLWHAPYNIGAYQNNVWIGD